MNDRRWYTEPESFIALAALIVSISAVVVGIYEASLQRHHDRAEVWPHLEIQTYVSPKGASLQVENTGIGPAIVQAVTVSVDGKPQHNWKDALTALLGRAPSGFNNSSITQHGLRAGEKTELVGLRAEDLPPEFWPQIARVSITICYASVFDEYWMVTDQKLGGASEWKSVRSCPVQNATVDL